MPPLMAKFFLLSDNQNHSQNPLGRDLRRGFVDLFGDLPIHNAARTTQGYVFSVAIDDLPNVVPTFDDAGILRKLDNLQLYI